MENTLFRNLSIINETVNRIIDRDSLYSIKILKSFLLRKERI